MNRKLHFGLIIFAMILCFTSCSSSLSKKDYKYVTCQNIQGDEELSRIKNWSWFENLEDLWIFKTSIKDITFLSDCDSINTLKLSQNDNLTDISSLADLDSLKVLELCDLPIDDFENIGSIDTLVELSLQNLNIKDISPIYSNNLQTLCLSRLPIVSIDFIEESSKLENFALLECNVSDVHSVGNLKEITSLTITNTPVKDITPLSNLKTLEMLSLMNNNISDISPLKSFINLKRLYLQGNPLTEDQIDELREALPNCDIYF